MTGVIYFSYNSLYSVFFIADEEETAEKTVHYLFKIVGVTAASCEYIVFCYAVHSACNEIDKVYAFLTGYVTHEIAARHQIFVLNVIQTVHHVVFYKDTKYLLPVCYVPAVSVTECTEIRRAA